MSEAGLFTISLDFELYWGVRDKRSLSETREYFDGVERAILSTLELFERYGIHATWATVGCLFAANRQELKAHQPVILPDYFDRNLSPYKYISEMSDEDMKYHFAPKLIDLIHSQCGQEVGSHSFSHYYCMEKGQTIDHFIADLRSAVEIATARGIKLTSFVFPRNQWKEEYLPALSEFEIECYRGNPPNWLYASSEGKLETKFRRILRFLDAYLNISGNNIYSLSGVTTARPYNIPASCFLRPYENKLALFESLRMRRIRKGIISAARQKKLFHLWWHPHNFGLNTQRNLEFLEGVLDTYKEARKVYGMRSLNMREVAEILSKSSYV